MNFFNIDLHISVIADIKKIIQTLGHNVNDKCLSDHAFIFNRQKDNVKVINAGNWRYLNKQMCDVFYNVYKDELKDYDGFICAYPPSFAMLYEKFNKPIIIQTPIRFEIPFQNNPPELKRFIDFLKNGIDNKQIIPIANSLYEKKYCEKFTDREWQLIPNICDYTNIDYNHTGKDFILYSKTNIKCNHPHVFTKDEYFKGTYNWTQLNNVKGVIHIPYNVSTMSIFEQYTGNIPLFFPTPEFCLELFNKNIALTEISWTNNKMITDKDWKWLLYADYYQQDWMKHIVFFSSFSDLKEKIETMYVSEISTQMKLFNAKRKFKIQELWKDVLGEL